MNMPYILQPAEDETLIKHIRTWLKALSLKKGPRGKCKIQELLSRPRSEKPRQIFGCSNGTLEHQINVNSSEIIFTRLCRNSENKTIFPEGMRNATNRRGPNLDEFIKPIIPRRFLQP